MKKENIPINQNGLKAFGKFNDNQKLPKPLIEKKRRARINRSLCDLRMLISDLLKKELMRTRSRRKSGKVEKADVLELAVQYIKEMKQEKSVQKELAFEAGYNLCQQNVENYFRKLKELNNNQISDEKSNCGNIQCVQCKQKAYLVQKDLLKTLDQQWTDYVQNLNYNRKMEDQRLTQFDGQEKVSNEITSANDFHKHQQMTVEQQAFNEKDSRKLFAHPEIVSSSSSSSMNPSNLINEKMNTLSLQNSSKYQSIGSSSTALTNTKKLFPLWKDKPLSKADELISIKLYNELVMHNLNRNKSLCSSASSTSSCSSASSYARTANSVTSNQMSNQLNNPQSKNSLPPAVMPVDLESSNLNYLSSSAVSKVDLAGQSYSERPCENKIQSIMTKYSNSPFKKRKKLFQNSFPVSDNLWRPW